MRRPPPIRPRLLAAAAALAALVAGGCESGPEHFSTRARRPSASLRPTPQPPSSEDPEVVDAAPEAGPAAAGTAPTADAPLPERTAPFPEPTPREAPAAPRSAPSPEAVPGERTGPQATPGPASKFDLPDSPLVAAYRATASRIIEESLRQDRAYRRLAHLCDAIGPRLSGSDALDRAIGWTAEQLAADGLDVEREEVLVPHWVRGEESAAAVAPVARELVALGLGNSVGTPAEGIEADVVVAHDFDELARLGEAVRGRIVLFNRPMAAWDPERGAGYGEAVAYRTRGPSAAARLGAVGVLVRSVTATSLRTPHTGMLAYEPGTDPIPAMAVTTEDADWIDRCAAAGPPVRVRMRMEARFEPDAPSANVVAGLRGSERPDEVVVIGAHLDSWDVGHGAQDDGANCIAVMEAVAVLRRLGLRPRRTIRAVLFTNEENGLRGGLGYAARHRDELGRHVAAIEADSGCYAPLGFTTPKAATARDRAFREAMEEVLRLLRPVGATRLRDGGGGADIGVMAPAGVPQLGLDVANRPYFDVHHTPADTFDKVAREDLDRVVATLAVTAFVLADAPVFSPPAEAVRTPTRESR